MNEPSPIRKQSVVTRPVLIVTAVLCLLAAVLGLWLGAEEAARSESDVIDAAVARWKAETGETDASTCIGRALFDENLWLEVRCGMGDNTRVYRFDRAGQLLSGEGPKT